MYYIFWWDGFEYRAWGSTSSLKEVELTRRSYPDLDVCYLAW